MPKSSPIPLDQLAPDRICLIKPSALGDVVQALPVLSGLRQRWPEAHISWVINRGLAPLLAQHPELDDVIAFDRNARGHKMLGSAYHLTRRLRRGRFDLTIDLQGLARSGLMTMATRARRRLGMSIAREGAALAYTDCIRIPTRDMPAVPRNWLIAQALGCQGNPPPARLGILAEQRSWARNTLSGLPRPLVAIHPGAAWATKRWPAGHFVSVARQALQQQGAGVVLVGSGADVPLCDAIAAQLPQSHCANLGGQTDLLMLAAVLEAADVMLAGDSGPMHLAAAVGTPVVAVFTCTSPLRAGPHGEGHRIAATGVPCAASYLKTCNSMICMQELAPHRVSQALGATIDETRSLHRQQAG